MTAAFGFFGGLKDEHGDAVKVRVFSQIAGRTQEHGGVTIVAAGVHPPRMARVVREFVELNQRQGIHIGTQADHAR